MSAAKPGELLKQFHWMVIPHGVSKSGTPEATLQATLRIVPRIDMRFIGWSARGAARVGDLVQGEPADASEIFDPVGVRAFFDWPDFIGDVKSIRSASARPLRSASRILRRTKSSSRKPGNRHASVTAPRARLPRGCGDRLSSTT
jgi:hypothetical protein